MSWRTVVISSRCKLDYKMGYMVIRGEEVKRIHLDEIAVLIIENPAIALTGCLLERMTEKKIKIIFCDSRRNPCSEVMPYYGSHDCSRKLRQQISWSSEILGVIWKYIVTDKIQKQAAHLGDRGKNKEANMLEAYANEVTPNDETNREGHAAKVYFNALFGREFSRRDAADQINAALNYGYSIILSAFNRTVTICGYSTQLGIHHGNVFNCFNLSSDLMEPFRILVDRAVSAQEIGDLDKELKMRLVNILNETVMIGGTTQTVSNAINIYCRSIFAAIESGDPDKIKTYSL